MVHSRHHHGCTHAGSVAVAEKEGIQDETGTNLVNLRRTIYLTIMNSVSPSLEMAMLHLIALPLAQL